MAAGFLIRMQNLQDTVAVAGAEVDLLRTLMLQGIGNCGNMSLGKVHDMDIVTHTGAVDRRIVVAPDTQVFQRAVCHPGNIRHQVVRNAVGHFPNQSGRMCADRIEIPKQHDAPLRIRRADIFQNHLIHQFCGAIGIRGMHLEILPDRHTLRRAVHGGTR